MLREWKNSGLHGADKDDRPFRRAGGGHGVGGQARGEKWLGRGGDDRGWQARAAGCRGSTAEEVGLTLAEGKNLLGELARLILQTQMEEFTTCARVCGDCLKLRRSAGSADPQNPNSVRDHHRRRASYQSLPLRDRLGLRGCLPVAPGGIASGPMHAGTPAASSGVERPAFLSRGGSAAGDASALRTSESRNHAQSNTSCR